MTSKNPCSHSSETVRYSQKTQAANAARGEALTGGGEPSYQARPAHLVCWQVFCKPDAPNSKRMKCQMHTAPTVPFALQWEGSNREQGWKSGGRQSRNCTQELVQRKITWALHSAGKGFFSMIHQHQFPSARTLHSSKYFQISQSHSARDQNKQVLWFINCDLKCFYSSHLFGVFVGMGSR